MESIDRRKTALLTWLTNECDLPSLAIQSMQGDASMRRYFRVKTPSQSFVAMDAPPPYENVGPYLAIAETLRASCLQAPTIFAANKEQGFLLLSDFGDITYLKALTTETAHQLYLDALQVLAVLQACQPHHVRTHVIPHFGAQLMYQEWAWHKEWFLEKWLHLSFANIEKELDECFSLLVESATAQPQVFMHRDYHSANLMVLPATEALLRVGVLDFQDAFIGPITYDLASLLRDCYIDWPNENVTEWALAYLHLLKQKGSLQDVSQTIFLRWFDLMGIERHLKALFTFARKAVRDHQLQYLKAVPRTLQYVLEISQHYPELASLHRYFKQTVQPAALQRIAACAL